VGGTNPSLLEALGSTDLNLLLDVGFNREVAHETALYWNKQEGDLAALIERADRLPAETIQAMGLKARDRIREAYSWEAIAKKYETLFLQDEPERNAP
jgi:rhamnosyltransferase